MSYSPQQGYIPNGHEGGGGYPMEYAPYDHQQMYGQHQYHHGGHHSHGHGHGSGRSKRRDLGAGSVHPPYGGSAGQGGPPKYRPREGYQPPASTTPSNVPLPSFLRQKHDASKSPESPSTPQPESFSESPEQTSPASPPPQGSGQQGGRHRDRNDCLEVYNVDFDAVLAIPRSAIVHFPIGLSRLVLCKHFVESSACAMKNHCKFVHADPRSANVKFHNIHVNYAWRSLDAVKYPVLPPGRILRVSAPNKREPILPIQSEFVLVTKGSDKAVSESSPRMASRCAHYYFNRICNRGADCGFIHTIHIDPSASEHQKAPSPMTNEQQQQQQQQQSLGMMPPMPGSMGAMPGTFATPVMMASPMDDPNAVAAAAVIAQQQQCHQLCSQPGQRLLFDEAPSSGALSPAPQQPPVKDTGADSGSKSPMPPCDTAPSCPTGGVRKGARDEDGSGNAVHAKAVGAPSSPDLGKYPCDPDTWECLLRDETDESKAKCTDNPFGEWAPFWLPQKQSVGTESGGQPSAQPDAGTGPSQPTQKQPARAAW